MRSAVELHCVALGRWQEVGVGRVRLLGMQGGCCTALTQCV